MTQLHLTLLSVTLVFLLTVLGVKLLLPRLQKKHAVQVILEIGPAWHKSKEGTPTMGGLAPLLACLIVGALLAPFLHKGANITPFVLTLLFAVANASVGILDDATKVWKARNLGLTPGQKLMLQSTFAIAYLTLLNIYGICDTRLPISFTQYAPDLGWFWYPICFVLLLWFVNCANLTDGIDGLASTVAALIGVFLVLAALFLSSVSATLCGALLFGGAFGFLLFNRHPAKIFMGDTGSLFFGALAVGGCFILGSPLLLLLPGIVYSLEGLSVVLQVGYFKLTHGKRLFRMAPLHHHMEKTGWGEWRIVLYFGTLTLIGCFFALWGILL